MTRAACGAIVLAMLTAKGETPASIHNLENEILAAAETQPATSRVNTLVQVASTLQFQFADEAKNIVLKAERKLSAQDDNDRARLYQIMLNLDTSEAVQIGARIRDQNVLYNAELQHCAENHDVGCGQRVLTKAHAAGAYRIASTRWVIDELAITDPSAARTAFASVLKLFPMNDADFQDVKVLLDSTQAIAKIDIDLARRAATVIEAAVEDPQFEARTQEIVTARFLVNGKHVETASTHETVLAQTQSFLKRGSFPQLMEMQFAIKNRSAVNQEANSQSGVDVDTLLQELTNRVQELNDFELQGLNGHQYRLKGLRGQPVLLDFWATWCAPCRKEMPRLDALARKGLTVLAITDEDEQVARKFVAMNRYSFPVLLDPQGRVFKIYEVVPRPTTILIDSTGRIIDRWIDLPESNVLEATFTRARPGNSH